MNIEKFCEINNLGTVKNITKLTGGLMHKMFKVETNKGIYAIKVLNKEVIARKEAYNNFVISEDIANLAKDNNINVSCALKINNNYLNELDGDYYMVFDFIEGKTLKDEEITIEHCKKIGKSLAQIHTLDYSNLDLEANIKESNLSIDWEKYINHKSISNMSYKDLLLANYKKLDSWLKRANERYNESNGTLTICHRDMDPKNVMWNNDNPVVIDWESASLDNPHRELIEIALSWSGFLSNNFDKTKFMVVLESYFNNKKFKEVEWYDVICGNLVGRFGWLKYNLERSLGIISGDKEEIKLAEKEVLKTIYEINRYVELIGTMYDILCDLTKKVNNTYDEFIEKIINNNELLQCLSYEKINAGFTNTIYKAGNYIIRICTNTNNEERFKNEIEFYNKNKDNKNIPKIFFSDTSKTIVPYYYEIVEKINGKTIYEVWYKLSNEERKEIVIKIVNILKEIHSTKGESFDYSKRIKNEIRYLLEESNITDELFDKLLELCDTYFKENNICLVHADLHFDNFILNENNLYLLDFERSTYAPIDYDFKIFNLCLNAPWRWASAKTDMLAIESDYENLMDMFIECYDKLREVKYLNERLAVYEIIDILKEYCRNKKEDTLNKAKDICKKLIG